MKLILILTTLLAFAFTAPAQSEFSDPEKMAELKKLLSLDDEQVAYLQKIERGHKYSLSETVANSEQGEARNKAIKELMDQKQKQIEEVLNKEQLEKYNVYLQNERQERSRQARMDLQQARDESKKMDQKDLKEGEKQ